MTIILTAMAPLFLFGLLYYEKKDVLFGRFVFKPLISSLFVFVALLQNAAVASYANGILAGLILSWTGDYFLIFDSKKMFLSGLISFLLAHVCYASVFYHHGTQSMMTALGLVVLLLPAVIIYLWLRPHLGKMSRPVICYMIVITAMLGGAFAVVFNPNIAISSKAIVLVGAILFYLSDIFVARDKFVKTEFFNRAVGLPLYYTGQFFFAFSVGFF